MKPEYKYRVKYRSNYDGDTIRFDFDLGLGTWNKGEAGKGVAVRLFGIDTPELRGGTDESKLKAKEAKEFVEEALLGASDIVVETFKDDTGKYGRYIAVVHYCTCPAEREEPWHNLNEDLVTHGLAVRKDY